MLFSGFLPSSLYRLFSKDDLNYTLSAQIGFVCIWCMKKQSSYTQEKIIHYNIFLYKQFSHSFIPSPFDANMYLMNRHQEYFISYLTLAKEKTNKHEYDDKIQLKQCQGGVGFAVNWTKMFHIKGEVTACCCKQDLRYIVARSLLLKEAGIQDF